MDFEFETTRTTLANAFAAAGAELLNYMGASAAQAAIPDTQPQKYAIAGTLPGILQMAGKMMGEEGAEQPLTIALGQGLIEVGQGHHGDERLPAILFGRNGAGAVGIETEGNRTMKPGECIAAITFENPQSLDVVAEKLGELRARIWPDAEMLPAKHVIAPHFRGYAHLGIGAYLINHSAAGEEPELAISVATEEQKAGRVVGDLRGNEHGELVHAKDIAVRLRFENVAGLDALEQQLRFVRSVHFPESDDERYAKLVSQVHYWMDRGDSATLALDAAEAEITELRAALASVTPVSAAEKPTGDLADEQIDTIGKKYAGLGGIEDYRSFAKDIERAAIAAYLARQPQAVPAALTEIGKLVATQDNRMTEAPMFVVEQKTPVISDSEYNDCRVEWRETENGDYMLASPERADRLEALFKDGRETAGWRRYEVTDVWTFVTACFTEQGCKDYLARNGHNLRETRIYAYGSYRNEEFRAIRNWLKSLAAPASQEGAHAALPEILEEIAQSWDGCMYDAVGETLDVGAVLRDQFKKLKTPASAERSGDHE